ncbi:MAG: extensin family protein [Hyphomicrobiaceae bacterium]|nr:extensin family protein [Hyphomicrobiaceae bacterium]
MGGSGGKISEHAFGNAVDLPVFVLADRRQISVLRHWGPTARDPKPEKKPEAGTAKRQTTGGDGEEVELPVRNPDRIVERSRNSRRTRRSRRRSRRDRRSRERSRRVEPSAGPSSGDQPPPQVRTPAAAYLRRLHAAACGPFNTVLGPEANEAHRNHFHFDLVARRRKAYCQ